MAEYKQPQQPCAACAVCGICSACAAGFPLAFWAVSDLMAAVFALYL